MRLSVENKNENDGEKNAKKSGPKHVCLNGKKYKSPLHSIYFNRKVYHLLHKQISGSESTLEGLSEWEFL